MVWPLRALAILAEGLGSVPRTDMALAPRNSVLF